MTILFDSIISYNPNNKMADSKHPEDYETYSIPKESPFDNMAAQRTDKEEVVRKAHRVSTMTMTLTAHHRCSPFNNSFLFGTSGVSKRPIT